MKLKTNLLCILFVLTLCGLLTAAAFAADQNLRVWSTEMSDMEEYSQETEENAADLIAPQVAAADVPTFTASDAVVEMIAYYEGFLETRYYDGGVAYIGYGSNFADAVAMFGEDCEPLTREQAKQLTKHELEQIEGYLNGFLKSNGIVVNQNQFDALADFTYNCGIGWTIYKNADGTWCLLKQLLLDDPGTWTESRVSEAFGTWVKDGSGNVLEGLKKRRASESQLFMKDAKSPMYTDVSAGAWYYDYVMVANELGIMRGNGDGTFLPQNSLTRAELVQVLANYAEADLSGSAASGFPDVAAGAWYAPAVAWAKENGYVSGYPDGTFKPNQAVTREEFCTIMSRYLQKQGVTYPTKTVTFADESQIDGYAKEHVAYCAGIGLVNGVGDDRFDPKAGTKRAEAATIMVRLVQLG